MFYAVSPPVPSALPSLPEPSADSPPSPSAPIPYSLSKDSIRLLLFDIYNGLSSIQQTNIAITVATPQIAMANSDKFLNKLILQKIKTNYSVEIYNSKGSKISGNELVGTGSVIKVLNNKDLIMEYNVIMYGDVNGDGKINSVDLLVLQRHILEIEKFSGVFLKAGNIRKNGRNPSSVDLLLIQRHILGLQNIVQ